FVDESENRSPFHSINFVACHDGFTLNDLVSYNEKHNERNGEENRDGANDNNSWNCGHEGDVAGADIPDETKTAIEALRRQQTKTPNLRNITWHGVKPGQPDFSGGSRFIAWVLEAFESHQRSDVPVYVATNTFWEPLTVELPATKDRHWYRVVDTSLPVGEDI